MQTWKKISEAIQTGLLATLCAVTAALTMLALGGAVIHWPWN